MSPRTSFELQVKYHRQQDNEREKKKLIIITIVHCFCMSVSADSQEMGHAKVSTHNVSHTVCTAFVLNGHCWFCHCCSYCYFGDNTLKIISPIIQTFQCERVSKQAKFVACGLEHSECKSKQ